MRLDCAVLYSHAITVSHKRARAAVTYVAAVASQTNDVAKATQSVDLDAHWHNQ